MLRVWIMAKFTIVKGGLGNKSQSIDQNIRPEHTLLHLVTSHWNKTWLEMKKFNLNSISFKERSKAKTQFTLAFGAHILLPLGSTSNHILFSLDFLWFKPIDFRIPIWQGLKNIRRRDYFELILWAKKYQMTNSKLGRKSIGL